MDTVTESVITLSLLEKVATHLVSHPVSICDTEPSNKKCDSSYSIIDGRGYIYVNSALKSETWLKFFLQSAASLAQGWDFQDALEYRAAVLANSWLNYIKRNWQKYTGASVLERQLRCLLSWKTVAA
jgi:hypothetical protein